MLAVIAAALTEVASSVRVLTVGLLLRLWEDCTVAGALPAQQVEQLTVGAIVLRLGLQCRRWFFFGSLGVGRGSWRQWR